MPKSRHKKATEANRQARRLERMSADLHYATQLLQLTDEALKGQGLEAVFNPEPVPHVELVPYIAAQAMEESNADPEADFRGDER